MKEEAMSDNTLMNLTRRMRGETTTTCDQCGKSYVGPNGTPLFVGLRDTGIGEDMLQAFCSGSARPVGSLHGPAASWFAIHFSPACHVFVILLAQRLHHFVGGLASGECSQHGHRERMPARSARIRAACWTDEAPECPGSASRPCARLDGHCAARAPQ